MIDLLDESGLSKAELAKVKARAEKALAALEVPKTTVVTLRLTTDAAISELNQAYLGDSGATDVLSFGADAANASEGPPWPKPHARILGDVVVSVDTARRQAAARGITLVDEVSHLIIHGILHLQGFDHEEADERARMAARHREIAHAMRISGDPYD